MGVNSRNHQLALHSETLFTRMHNTHMGLRLTRLHSILDKHQNVGLRNAEL